MTTTATAFGYGARVFQPIETDPNRGGGPIRRTPLVAVRAHAGRFVQRSPHKMIPDPGRIDEPQLLTEKFLPDGRLVPDHALGAFPPIPARTRYTLYGGVVTLALTGVGVLVGGRDHRAAGAMVGAFVGAAGSALVSLGGEGID